MHGIKKSLNKVNQYVNEKIGTSKPTAYDETYIQMEKDVDQLIKMFYDLSSKIGDILQPNPHVRAKMAAYSHLAKIRGDTNSESYQHTTKSLANSLIRESNTFNKCTLFSEALRETGQSFGDIAQYNQEFDHTVKTKVLEVIDSIMKGKIATSVKLRRKVHSNRLMYDSRKRKDEKSIKTTQAHTKFRDSLSKSKKQMYNVVYKSQVFENISILESLVNSQIELETNSLNSLENLSKKLAEIK
ncbi:Endophilin-3 [Intoshia linei]|uniref:Endophilin-3 n=1 Tax=Intoshia linei TaxID=1819745 RepID=A0A177AW68_9BILA|nr:Endophilin-3 [Intoshia linei]